MGLLKRVLGICRTRPPADRYCWKPGDGKIEVDLARAAELGQPGGAIRLDPLPGEALVECCSVGKSRFDYTGARRSGSAKKPVKSLQVEAQDGKLIISLP